MEHCIQILVRILIIIFPEIMQLRDWKFILEMSTGFAARKQGAETLLFIEAQTHLKAVIVRNSFSVQSS